MTNDILMEIVRAAATAPSVANSQPWFFSAIDSTLRVHFNKKRAESLGNSANTLSNIGFGCVIENIAIAARHFGFEPLITFFPEFKSDNIIAEIIMVKEDVGENNCLYEAIFSRHTNRRLYNNSPIPAHIRRSLISVKESFQGADLHWVENKNEIRRIASVVKQSDALMYEHPQLHSDLFKWVRWSDKNARETGDGLTVKSLEINKFQAVALKMVSSWKVMSFLNRFGVNHLISDFSYKSVISSPAIGLIVMDKCTPEDYFIGGRMLQRLWLTANLQGLSLHPMCPVVVLPSICHLFDGRGFGDKHKKVLEYIYDEIIDIFNIEKENALIMLIRVGYADQSRGESLRRPLKENFRGLTLED